MSEFSDVDDDDDEVGSEFENNVTEVSAQLKRRLIRTVRDVEVILPTIHQEDLVVCMRTPSFRKLQEMLAESK